ncbi:hypothetical protein [Nocardioides sp.]|uniref:hypothetical protein n=1 Tax=Nocardioides sp. TaxID=35761 RepID=UPI00261ABC17|nr:hypothetical protein [Nocardioides sp.]
MTPAVLDPVHLIDDEDRHLPAIVTGVEQPLLTLRMDDGVPGALGTAYGLLWQGESSMQRQEVVVVERLVVDGTPTVRVEPRGEIVAVQRRHFVRVPVQREIRLTLSPIPLDPGLAGTPTSIRGLTLDVAEAALRCSVRPSDAVAFVAGTTLEASFEVGGEPFALLGEVFRVRSLATEEPPRVELVVTLHADEAGRRTLRKALFSEQVAMRGRKP